jgi:hypothetical protein
MCLARWHNGYPFGLQQPEEARAFYKYIQEAGIPADKF